MRHPRLLFSGHEDDLSSGLAFHHRLMRAWSLRQGNLFLNDRVQGPCLQSRADRSVHRPQLFRGGHIEGHPADVEFAAHREARIDLHGSPAADHDHAPFFRQRAQVGPEIRACPQYRVSTGTENAATAKLFELLFVGPLYVSACHLFPHHCPSVFPGSMAATIPLISGGDTS